MTTTRSDGPGTDAYREASDEAAAIQRQYQIDMGETWWNANVSQVVDLATASKQQILQTFITALERDFPISQGDPTIRTPRAA